MRGFYWSLGIAGVISVSACGGRTVLPVHGSDRSTPNVPTALERELVAILASIDSSEGVAFDVSERDRLLATPGALEELLELVHAPGKTMAFRFFAHAWVKRVRSPDEVQRLDAWPPQARFRATKSDAEVRAATRTAYRGHSDLAFERLVVRSGQLGYAGEAAGLVDVVLQFRGGYQASAWMLQVFPVLAFDLVNEPAGRDAVLALAERCLPSPAIDDDACEFCRMSSDEGITRLLEALDTATWEGEAQRRYLSFLGNLPAQLAARRHSVGHRDER